MTDLVEMLKERQGKTSIEVYANQMDIRGATLFRFYKGQREISLSSVRKMAEYYHKQGDTAMLEALAEYALELNSNIQLNISIS